MYGNIAPRIVGQAAPSLNELAARVRKAQAGFVAAASSAVLHAIEAGQALIAAKKLAPHGQWGKFLEVCGIGLGDNSQRVRTRSTWLHRSRLPKFGAPHTHLS